MSRHKAALLKSENDRRLLDAVMEALPVGVAITDVLGGIIRSNRTYEQIWRSPRPETRSHADYWAYKAWWSDTGRPLEPEEWAASLAVQKGKAIVGQLLRIQRFDGTEAFVINSAAPVTDMNGNIVGCAVAIQDISELKQAELELRGAHSKIKDILEQMSDGFISFDNEWRCTYINTAAANAFQMDSEQILGKLIWEVWPAAYDLPLGINFRRSLQENIPINFEAFYPDPLNRWFECRCHPTPEGLVIFFTDITGRKRYEEALKQLNNELEKRVEERTAELREKDQMLLLQGRQAAMGEMIGNIAHQWRQPLNTLGLTIQQLSNIDDPAELTTQFLEDCVKSSMKLIQHMSKTIDDFSNYFRPDKDMSRFEVHKAIVNTLSLMEVSLRKSKINVDIVEREKIVIYGYQNEFAQVLINILNNARDALIESGVDDPRVTITILKEDGRAVVTIADNAGGIPEEIMDKIFDPYFTTKMPQQGTGVGLFMSKAIIEKNMGGSLKVRNINSGAEFRIEVCEGKPIKAHAVDVETTSRDL